jgi:hypothetical protein
MVRWLWRQIESPARRSFALGWFYLFLGALQLAALPGSSQILMWTRLLFGVGLMVAGVALLRIGITLRRKRRKELLRAVATAVTALERHRREEPGPGQG